MTKKKQDPGPPKDRVPLSLAERSTPRGQTAVRMLAHLTPRTEPVNISEAAMMRYARFACQYADDDEARVLNENGQCFCPVCNARRVAWEAEVAEGGEQMTESSFKNTACRADNLATTNEPTIMINGHVLTEAQARTLRVAVESFAAALRRPEGAEELGDIGPLYLERVQEIRKLMYGGR